MGRAKGPSFMPPEERAALRRAHLSKAGLGDLSASEIQRATEGAIPLARARELRALALFQRLPGIGPAMAEDFLKLGYREPAELAGEDPQRMVRRLERMTGAQDPCVGDAFACAVYYAENPDAPHDRQWWDFSRERLAGEASKERPKQPRPGRAARSS